MTGMIALVWTAVLFLIALHQKGRIERMRGEMQDLRFDFEARGRVLERRMNELETLLIGAKKGRTLLFPEPKNTNLALERGRK
jgi:hypothetical protein